MKRPAEPVPLRKAVSIIALGMVCGFCAVTAVLRFSEHHLLSPATLGFAAGAVLTLIGAVAFNRLL